MNESFRLTGKYWVMLLNLNEILIEKYILNEARYTCLEIVKLLAIII